MRSSVLLLLAVLAACATPGPSERGIAIEAVAQGQPLTGANCVVSTGAGSWSIVTPAVVDVGIPSGDLRVVCDRAGYRTSETIHRAFAPGGGPSVGLGIGGGSRSVGGSLGMSLPLGGTARYPSRVRVEMNPVN
jgi:hypothetical protein